MTKAQAAIAVKSGWSVGNDNRMGLSHTNPAPGSVPLRILEDAVDRFEQSWRTGRRPAIEDYCQPATEGHDALLLELALIDIEHRVNGGEQACVEDYLERFPKLRSNERAVLDLVAAERRLRQRCPPECDPAHPLSGNTGDVVAPLIASEQGNQVVAPSACDPAPQDRTPSGRAELDGETTCPRKDSNVDEHANPRPASSEPWPRDVDAQLGGLRRFRVLDRLGQGAFGSVYRAIDVELDRLVALKVPRAGAFTSDEERERFLREARSAARLRHPNIMPIYEVGSEGEHPYLVSALVTGQTLAAILETRAFRVAEAAAVVVKLADALHYAHEQSVIHRDVKPSNIMVDSQGVPILLDFGLAKRDGIDVSLTLEGHVLGTPAYMSPEQALGEVSKIDARSDVYSLGVVLYELLTSERPFRGDARELIHKVVNQEPRSPRAVDKRVPRDLSTICLKCLEKSPGSRYQTAGELSEDLGRYLSGHPIHARPVSLAEKVWRRVRRRPWTSSLVATAVSLVVALASVALVARNRIDSAQQRTAAEAARAIHSDQTAETAKQESRVRLARFYLTRGEIAVDAGNIVAALPWFAKAWEVRRSNDARDSVHRARLVTALHHAPRLVDLLSLSGSVNSLVSSPDERLVAVACSESIAVVYELKDPKGTQTLLQHGGAVLQCTFDPCGEYVATVCYDRKVRIWPVRAMHGQPVTLTHPDFPTWASFSPDSKWIATACHDGVARIWNRSTGAPSMPSLKHGGSVSHLTFSGDGTLLGTAGTDGTARIWSVTSREQIGSSLTHDGRIHRLAFSPDGRHVATASADNTARIWDLASHELKGNLYHDSQVMQLRYTHSGDKIITGSANGTISLWNAVTGTLSSTLSGHAGPILQISISADDMTVATASEDKTARVWNLASGRLACSPVLHAAIASVAEISRDGRHLLTAGFDGIVKRWAIEPAFRFDRQTEHGKSIRNVEFSPWQQRILLNTESGGSGVYGLGPGMSPSISVAPGFAPRAWSLAPHGPWLACGLADGAVEIWDVGAKKLLRTWRHHHGPVIGVRFVPHGDRVLSLGIDGKAILCRRDSDVPVMRFAHVSPLTNAEFSADGETLFTVDDNHSLRAWDVGSGNLRSHVTAVANDTSNCVVSPDGGRFLAMGRSSGANIQETSTGAIVHALSHSGYILHAAFSADGSRLATASQDNTARVWDVATGARITGPLSHSRDVTFCVFSPNAELIATGSDDHTARLWDARTGEPVSPYLQHTDRVAFLAFQPDGSELISVSADGNIRVWTLDDLVATRDQLSRAARLYSGHEIDDTGSRIPVSARKLEQDWAEFRNESSPRADRQ